MEITDYPKEIYLTTTPNWATGEEGISELWDEDDSCESDAKYIRSDLVGKQTSLPKWHRYPDEEPPLPTTNKAYLVTAISKHDDGDIIGRVVAFYTREGRWYYYSDITDIVLAWCEIPEPFKED